MSIIHHQIWHPLSMIICHKGTAWLNIFYLRKTLRMLEKKFKLGKQFSAITWRNLIISFTCTPQENVIKTMLWTILFADSNHLIHKFQPTQITTSLKLLFAFVIVPFLSNPPIKSRRHQHLMQSFLLFSQRIQVPSTFLKMALNKEFIATMSIGIPYKSITSTIIMPCSRYQQSNGLWKSTPL